VKLAELAYLAKKYLPKKQVPSFTPRKKTTKNKNGNTN
jgi:hypothetical protein